MSEALRMEIDPTRIPPILYLTLPELEALRKILSLSHLIDAQHYSSRGLNQEKIESHAHEIFMRLEESFGGFSTFAEEEHEA